MFFSERPLFPDCLKNINSRTTVREGSSLDMECLMTGVPTPKLKCELRSYDGSTLMTIPRSTTNNGILPSKGIAFVTYLSIYVCMYQSIYDLLLKYSAQLIYKELYI